ncbi:pentatricopeptide repeat-containing protein At2g15820, chloroplastic [Diospyros lotus]|uniref:pentatricopeptide repeat-containing protein At2g15820, chloroplastic n=1 Tax=Diospyros lotus TaxID=55363 RepID=UPI00224E65B9|nr:pentatricopeptide repeat-containing protein At2g15820, chloroplastic [Diospyros lotus]
MLLSGAHELSPFAFSLFSTHSPNPNPNSKNAIASHIRAAFSFLLHRHCRSRPASVSLLTHSAPSSLSFTIGLFPSFALSAVPPSTLVQHLADETDSGGVREDSSMSASDEAELFNFNVSLESNDLRRQWNSPNLEVRELQELPEQWRRAKLAWLCKELPAHRPAMVFRILSGQRKWIRQEDATYLAVHCMRIRENDTGFRVYKWMKQQSWFRFDFALATKLADYMGKERKCIKCRDIFDDIINQGQVPSESTFHILVVAYLSSPVQGFLKEACSVYNLMIQLGGYKPQLSLHNSLFRALVSGPGGSSKQYLKQAELIFHNLATFGFEIHSDVYGGLIWLHSYQDTTDKERIVSLRAEMQVAGIQESREVLLSILRACSKEGDVQEAEKTWLALLHCGDPVPSQAFVYRMEVYAKIRKPLKSLEVFREMEKRLGSANVVAYHKIIEVLSNAQEVDVAESLMREFMESCLKPLMPSFIDLMRMYSTLNLHDKLESTFLQSLGKCHPNRTIYNMYLDSLVKIGNIEKAEEIFNQMLSDGAIGVNAQSSNSMLRGYLSNGEYAKAEKIYDLMCQKKYDIESPLMDMLDHFLSMSRKVVKKPLSLKLSEEQREVLVGMLLGGLCIESDEEGKRHAIVFEFNETCKTHSVLKRHIYGQYHEWLALSKPNEDSDDIPHQFSTISHTYFSFYADQFWSKGQPKIPRLIHRWLSPRVLAYWYMFGGYRTSSGDILLKLRSSQTGVERIVKALKEKSLNCQAKSKGKVFWIGFLGNNSTWFWKLVESYVLDDLRDFLEAGGKSLNKMSETQVTAFGIQSNSDGGSYINRNQDNQ